MSKGVGWETLTEVVEGIPYLGSKWAVVQRTLGSPEAVVRASVDDFCQVPGVGRAVAEQIVDRLRSLMEQQSDALAVDRAAGLPDSERIFAQVEQWPQTPGATDEAQVGTRDAAVTRRYFAPPGARFRVEIPGGVFVGDQWVGHVPYGLQPSEDAEGIDQVRRSHVARGFLQGCRCDRCMRRWVNSVGVVAMRVEGHTLNDIGEHMGLTRERVRQISERAAPWGPWRAVATERRALREEVSRNATVRIACVTCGTEFEDTIGRSEHRAYCSAACRDAYSLLRYHVDEERRNRHRIHVARWAVSNPAKIPDFQLRSARQILEKGPEHGSGARWLIEGSGSFKVAVRACRENWPIFEQLPTAIQIQVKEHLGVETTEKELAESERERTRRGAASRPGPTEDTIEWPNNAKMATASLEATPQELRKRIVSGDGPAESTGCFRDSHGWWWYRISITGTVLEWDEIYAPINAFPEAPLSRFVQTRLSCGEWPVSISPMQPDGTVSIGNVWAITRNCQAIEGDYVFLRADAVGNMETRRVMRTHIVQAESSLQRLLLEVGAEPAGSPSDVMAALGLGITDDVAQAIALCKRRGERDLGDLIRSVVAAED